jgi:hypothetical protein
MSLSGQVSVQLARLPVQSKFIPLGSARLNFTTNPFKALLSRPQLYLAQGANQSSSKESQ